MPLVVASPADPTARPGRGWLAALILPLALLLALAAPLPAVAISAADLPDAPPATRLLDRAGLFSRASTGEIEAMLEEFGRDRVDARLVTVDRLDYGLDLDRLGTDLLQRWGGGDEDLQPRPPLLLLLFDSHARSTAVVASPALQRQLPPELLRSTARTTMAQPLRDGQRYRQATLDALRRLGTVLEGGEDPGEPEVAQAATLESNVPSREETRESNALTWVVVLLVVGSVVPMLTWWVFSR